MAAPSKFLATGVSMPRILLTAFGPYDDWQENTSWLVLQEVARLLPPSPNVTTRLYPVDFAEVDRRLASDLATGCDVAIHLGQAPGQSAIGVEAIGLNVRRERGELGLAAQPLVADGPTAYLSQLPLADWAALLRAEGIPADVRHHAGTYLCNAALYLSHWHGHRLGTGNKSTFLHLPLATEHLLRTNRDLPSLPLASLTAAVLMVVAQIGSDGSPARIA